MAFKMKGYSGYTKSPMKKKQTPPKGKSATMTPEEKLAAAKKRFPNKKITLSSDGKIMYGGPKGDSGGVKRFKGTPIKPAKKI